MNSHLSHHEILQPFALTHWSMVLKACGASAPGSDEAMEEFAKTYWQPLYGYIRGQGYNREDAQDLTQGFYQHLNAKGLLGRVTEQRGKFRAFLLTCLRHYLADQLDYAKAKKRGGKAGFISLDALEAEERDAIQPATSLTPDQFYDWRWAKTLVDRACERLRQEHAAKGKAELYEVISNLQIANQDSASYAAIGTKFGMSISAVKSAVRRLRLRFLVLLRSEIESTVNDPVQLIEELSYLQSILGRSF